jgi:putative PLP-dependent aminotransferase (TIGR04422 family)
MAEDIQWPSLDSTETPFLDDANPERRAEYVEHIESHFESRFGVEAVLIPSDRAAISMILSANDISRGDSVFAPQWSSHCVWDAISHIGDPSAHTHSDLDAAIAVHKWGKVHEFAGATEFLTIEDSVDSLFVSDETLFPNGGRYEIISLPKIIGSYTGGIVLCRDSSDAAAISDLRGENVELGRHQSKLRFQETRGDELGFKSWRHMEHSNRYLDLNAVTNIERCLAHYSKNKETIQDRLAVVRERTSVDVDDGRLPPLISVPEDETAGTDDSIMSRHVNRSRLLDEPVFERASLLPLHFGVDDEYFEQTLNQLFTR